MKGSGKMKLSIVTFIALSIVAGSSQALASWRDRCQPYPVVTLLKRVLLDRGVCQFHQPTLTKTQWEDILVEAWDGGYFRDATYHDTVLAQNYYPCTGATTDGHQIETETVIRYWFKVDNPNLADDVQESYVAHAPMTDDELLDALNVAYQKCEGLDEKLGH